MTVYSCPVLTAGVAQVVPFRQSLGVIVQFRRKVKGHPPTLTALFAGHHARPRPHHYHQPHLRNLQREETRDQSSRPHVGGVALSLLSHSLLCVSSTRFLCSLCPLHSWMIAEA